MWFVEYITLELWQPSRPTNDNRIQHDILNLMPSADPIITVQADALDLMPKWRWKNWEEHRPNHCDPNSKIQSRFPILSQQPRPNKALKKKTDVEKKNNWKSEEPINSFIVGGEQLAFTGARWMWKFRRDHNLTA